MNVFTYEYVNAHNVCIYMYRYVDQQKHMYIYICKHCEHGIVLDHFLTHPMAQEMGLIGHLDAFLR